MKILAGIDIGANSIRMTIAEIDEESKKLNILEKIEYPLRLGKHTFLNRYISPEALFETIKILNMFRLKLEEYQIKRYRVVATSAIRDIENKEFFIEQVRLKTNFSVEIIERSEEERLVFLGLREYIKDFDKYLEKGVFFAKIGSGNVEVSILKSNEAFFSRSIPIGGLRLRQALRSIPEESFADAMEKYIYSDIKMLKQSLPKINSKYFIGAGSLLGILQEIVSPDSEIIEYKKLEKFYNGLKSLSISQIAEKYSLPYEHADLILPSAFICLSFLELSKTDELLVKDVSFTESILMHKAGFFKDKFLSKQIWKSAVRIGEKYQFDRKHAMQVSKLSLDLYDNLKELHNLAPRHRLILKLAALWHDIGIFILNAEHHKHSYYLISNIELPGLTKRDIGMIAAIARYHRRSMPKKYHEEYKMLSDRDRVVVSKLAAILRIADALDRSHSQIVDNLRIETEENNIIIYASFKEGGWIEKMHFNSKKDLFLRVFGTNIELIESVG